MEQYIENIKCELVEKEEIIEQLRDAHIHSLDSKREEYQGSD